MPLRTTSAAALAPPEAEDASRELLAWYDRHARVLPWRVRAPARPDPFRVWLAEIMLQQTTVAAVAPYFRDFLARWPTVEALARAPLDDILAAWAGLGYYARARNLHKCARIVAELHGGRFPDTEAALRDLPGVGPYTAAAIAAIAFDRPAVVVDGNVERVVARMFAIADPLPAAKSILRAAAAALTPSSRAGDYAQAVMDLGATICTPRRPRCMVCPWAARCAARRADVPERFPVKAPKAERPRRRGVAFLLLRADGAVWLRRRPHDGLLGGMLEVPSAGWEDARAGASAPSHAAPVAASWRETPGAVSHGFTHFDLELKVRVAPAGRRTPSDKHGLWVAPDRLGEVALPTLMRKVVAHGLRHAALAGRAPRPRKN